MYALYMTYSDMLYTMHTLYTLYTKGKTMISIHIPKGKESPDLKKEMQSASNIKDRFVRNSTVSGLNKIAQYL